MAKQDIAHKNLTGFDPETGEVFYTNITGIEESFVNKEVTWDNLIDWTGGELIQKALPMLSAKEREFIITGISDELWDVIFADEDEEDAKSA